MGENITLAVIVSESEFSNLERADDVGKPIEFECIISVVVLGVMLWRDGSFGCRKKRPYEKGRKKRRKGTQNRLPLFSSARYLAITHGD